MKYSKLTRNIVSDAKILCVQVIFRRIEWFMIETRYITAWRINNFSVYERVNSRNVGFRQTFVMETVAAFPGITGDA